METSAAELAGMGLAPAAACGAERKRVEAMVETLAKLHSRGETLAEVAHDARNMVTALGLYCDLIEEPGVLSDGFRHYASELKLVATASRRLVEKLVDLDARPAGPAGRPRAGSGAAPRPAPLAGEPELLRRWDLMPALPIQNLAAELLSNRNLLAALAGPSIALTVDVLGGALPVRLSGEDLTRILVNLIRNAAEAMPAGGLIQIGLRERAADSSETSSSAGASLGVPPWLALTVEDSGPGISLSILDRIFDSGFTTHTIGVQKPEGWSAPHRGLGLAIARSIVAAAGGRIHAVNRSPAGARFQIDLPVSAR